MPISTKLVAGGLAGAALLLSAGAALAEPGQATASVNVRSGPGVGYSVVDTLYPGENVDIQQCEGGWCYVDPNSSDPVLAAEKEQAKEIVAKCPSTEKRTIRFLNSDTQNTTLFITCLGAASGTEVTSDEGTAGTSGAAGTSGSAGTSNSAGSN